MAKHFEIRLEKRGVTAVAKLLEDQAPRTCRVVWEGLPLSAQVYHGKYCRNEVYHLLPAWASEEPGRENPTVTPIPGDLLYWTFDRSELQTPSHGYKTGEGPAGMDLVVDIAYFYGRNNLLLNPDYGWVPGNVFATVVEGLDDLAEASQDLWLRGVEGETLSLTRLER